MRLLFVTRARKGEPTYAQARSYLRLRGEYCPEEDRRLDPTARGALTTTVWAARKLGGENEEVANDRGLDWLV